MSRFIKRKTNNFIYDGDEQKNPTGSNNLESLIDSLNSLSNNEAIKEQNKKEEKLTSNKNILPIEDYDKSENKIYSIPSFTFVHPTNSKEVGENKKKTDPSINIVNIDMDIDFDNEMDNDMLNKVKKAKEAKRKLNDNLENDIINHSVLLSIKDNIINNLKENIFENNESNPKDKEEDPLIDNEENIENALNQSDEEDYEYIQWERNRINQYQGKTKKSKKDSSVSIDESVSNRLGQINEIFKEYDFSNNSKSIYDMDFHTKQEYQHESLNEKYNNLTNQLRNIIDNINSLDEKSKYLKDKFKFYLTQDNIIHNELHSISKLTTTESQEKNNDFYLSD